AAGVLFITVPARFALAVPAVVLLFLVYEKRGANVFVTQAGAGSRNGGIQVRHVDWVDRAVGSNADVAFLFTNARPPQAFWQNEFFNRSVDRLYNFVGRPLDGLPQQYIATDPNTGVVRVVGGAPIRTKYVLTDTSQILDGRPIASDEGVGLRLYRVPGRVRVIGGFAGIYPDAWSGPTATFTANACPGGRLSMRLTGDPDLVPHPQTIVARSGARELGRIVIPPRHFNVPFSIPLVPKNGVCKADFTISPTGIPKLVFNRPDSRVLGIRFLDVRYEPAR
ncbi:MAG: hypothetical protein QOG06_1624, partial [Gaiellaceae bacterium]|nr:hypothetical protein [Gaiellaceae bacterium]